MCQRNIKGSRRIDNLSISTPADLLPELPIDNNKFRRDPNIIGKAYSFKDVTSPDIDITEFYSIRQSTFNIAEFTIWYYTGIPSLYMSFNIVRQNVSCFIATTVFGVCYKINFLFVLKHNSSTFPNRNIAAYQFSYIKHQIFEDNSPEQNMK